MKTAWLAFIEWRSTRNDVADALDHLNGVLTETLRREAIVVDILRRHGPVTHDGHVYWLRGDEIVVEPVVASSQVILEEEKQ